MRLLDVLVSRCGGEEIVAARYGFAPDRVRAWRAGLRCSPSTTERLRDAVTGKPRRGPLADYGVDEGRREPRATRPRRGRDVDVIASPAHEARVELMARRYGAGLSVFDGTPARDAVSVAQLAVEAEAEERVTALSVPRIDYVSFRR